MLKIRFIFVGLLCTAMASVLLPVLYFATKTFWLAATGTAVICTTTSYIFHRKYVFKSRDKISAELARFVGGALTLSAIGTYLSYVSLQKFGAANYLLANTILNIALGVTSFVYHNTVSFLKNMRVK